VPGPVAHLVHELIHQEDTEAAAASRLDVHLEIGALDVAEVEAPPLVVDRDREFAAVPGHHDLDGARLSPVPVLHDVRARLVDRQLGVREDLAGDEELLSDFLEEIPDLGEVLLLGRHAEVEPARGHRTAHGFIASPRLHPITRFEHSGGRSLSGSSTDLLPVPQNLLIVAFRRGLHSLCRAA
jgi:hypothetical protein